MSAQRVATLAFFALALAGSAAAAQTNPDVEISRGVALRREGRDEEALQVFEGAWRSSHEARALAQVSLAEQALGRWVDAESHLVDALGSGGDPWVRAHLAVLQSALADIRQHVGRLEVQGEPAGAEVLIEGRVVGTLPLPAMLHVRTGSLSFTVRREGYIPTTRSVVVSPTYPLRESVALTRATVPSGVAEPAVPATPHPPRLVREPNHSPALRNAGFVLIGVGLAGLVTSGIFIGLNLSAAGDAESATPTSADPYGAWARFQASENAARQRTGSEQCDLAQQRAGADAQQVRDLCSRLSTSATVGLVAGVAGGALLVAGVVMAVAGRAPSSRATARWSASPWLAANLGGATLAVRW